MRFLSHQSGAWRTHRTLLLLIVFLCLVFVGQIVSEVLGLAWPAEFRSVPADVVAAWDALREGRFSGEGLWDFVTLFTCTLLHADIGHLLGNMLLLWIFAAVVKELLGSRWMFVIFVVTGILGTLVHTIFNAGEAIPILGASGAVMGFEGAYLALVVRWRLPDPHVWPMARPVAPGRLAFVAILYIIGDYMGLVGPAGAGIAYGAHIGGFIGGIFLTGFLAPRPPQALPR